MTRDELKANDGKNGRKAYVAVNGNIYDFTDSPMWAGGDHQGAHQAGCDLTEELSDAPHVRAVIERFPVVGKLEDVQEEKKGGSTALLFIIGAVIILGIIAALVL